GAKLWATTESNIQFFEITNVRGMYSTSEMVAHFGLGKEKVVETLKVIWPDGKINVRENVAANQTLTINYSEAGNATEEANEGSETILREGSGTTGLHYLHEENKFDDYQKQVLLPHKMSTLGPNLSVGDINQDGKSDLFIGGTAGIAGQLYVQSDNGTFSGVRQAALINDRLYEDMGSVFIDVDKDGDLDLYVVSGGNEFEAGSKSYQDRLYLNDGTGQLTSAPDKVPELTTSGGKVRACDFDEDGDEDLLVLGRHIPWSYPEPASSALLLNENGVFKNVTTTVASDLIEIGLMNDAQWIDYDQDGMKDIVMAGEWTSIIILKNLGEEFRKITSVTLDQAKGWWFSLEVADIDSDGDSDLLAGNLGLNYKYKATDEEPFEVYHYDFDNNGSKDVVLTYYNFGIQYPLRGRQCSAEQIPMLEKQFETYDIFASSDVSEIYGEDKLSESLHLEATTFASGYFENKGEGEFEFHALPVESQISSINDFVVEDVNDDGHLDIVLAGNQFNVEVETTRADAGYGMLLLGDGAGGFTSQSKNASGFYVPSEVRSMSKILMDGHPALIVGSNADSLKIFSW
ncbi:MAG: FG-GAP-like repeat-containing protein, partial [Saprospiraceae bacterium]|nr:FG-GAP-like repeat-containing protein [Saprospiraceae bacterium]